MFIYRQFKLFECSLMYFEPAWSQPAFHSIYLSLPLSLYIYPSIYLSIYLSLYTHIYIYIYNFFPYRGGLLPVGLRRRGLPPALGLRHSYPLPLPNKVQTMLLIMIIIIVIVIVMIIIVMIVIMTIIIIVITTVSANFMPYPSLLRACSANPLGHGHGFNTKSSL